MAMKPDAYEGIEDKQTTKGQEANLPAALWAFFSSMRTAIGLLLLLAAVSIIGTVVQQNGMPEEYVSHYGKTTAALLQALSFTNVYKSLWYQVLLGLIGINLAVCSINRLKIVWRQTRQPKVLLPADNIGKMPKVEKINSRSSVDEAAGKVISALRSGSYRILKEQDGADVAVHASKGALSLWGPYLTHLSLLVIFIGAIYGGYTGFSGYAIINQGQSITTYERGDGDGHQKLNLGFRVALNGFRIEHDKDHNPTGYKSDLRIYQGDSLVAQKVIDVNHPITYRGVSFFQSDYGLAGFEMKVTAPDGNSVSVPFEIETGIAPTGGKSYSVSGEPFKTVLIDGKKITIFAHDIVPDYVGGNMASMSDLTINPAVNVMVNDRFPEYKGLEAWTKLGWMAGSSPVTYKGLSISVDKIINYSGLQVSLNPGLPMVYAGFILLLVGVFMSFYISRMIVRIRISPSNKGAVVVMGAMSRGDVAGFDRDFARVREAITN